MKEKKKTAGLPLRLGEELETAPKETMKAVGSSELGLLPAKGDDEENGFVLASSWGENGERGAAVAAGEGRTTTGR